MQSAFIRKIFRLGQLTALTMFSTLGQATYAQADGIGNGASDGTNDGTCAAVTINISTGVDNSGVTLATGVADPNWSCPTGMGNAIAAYSGWSSLPGTRWLGTSAPAGQGYYTYTRNFNVPISALITIEALADNNVQIELDGNPICQTPGLTMYGFLTGNKAYYSGSVTAGAHTVTAKVYNEDSQTGLDLSGFVTYSTTNTSIDMGTGLNYSFVFMPPGSADPNWSCTTAGFGTVQVPHPYWDNLPGSEWLGINTGFCPAAYYMYNRTFTIPGPIGYISFDALADNYVEFFLDASSTPFAQTPALNPLGYKLANMVSYTGAVTGGTHTIHARVFNTDGPIGLTVQGHYSYCDPGFSEVPCTTDPSFNSWITGFNTFSFFSSTNPVNTPTSMSNVFHYWSFGDGGVSSVANPVYTYSPPASTAIIYTVTHTVTKFIYLPHSTFPVRCDNSQTCTVTFDGRNGGDAAFDCGVFNPRAANSAVTAADIAASIYPNPAQNELHISKSAGACDITITGIDGRRVLTIIGFTGETVDISALAAGSYLMKVVQEGKAVNLQFNKIK